MQKLNLTWPKYPNQLKEIMQEMIDDEYKDVTLVSDDKRSIKAHRNILSASSPVFKHMLELVTQSSHPVIYLRGIQFLEIESIIKYIYLGKAELLQERMNEFLSAATNLEIRELSTSFEVSQSNNRLDMGQNVNVSNDVTQPSVIESTDKQHERIDLLNLLEGEEKDRENIFSNISDYQTKCQSVKCDQCDYEAKQQHDLKLHIRQSHNTILVNTWKMLSNEDVDSTSETPAPEIEDKLNEPIELEFEKKISKLQCPECDQSYSEEQNLYKHIRNAHYKFSCNKCENKFLSQTGLTNHIQSKHKGVKYACNQCDHQATQPSNLSMHIQSVHEGVKYACNQCDYQATQPSNLKVHMERRHGTNKYACNMCHFETKAQYDLKLHIKHKHPSDCVACEHCDKQFTSHAKYVLHVKKKHAHTIGLTIPITVNSNQNQ